MAVRSGEASNLKLKGVAYDDSEDDEGKSHDNEGEEEKALSDLLGRSLKLGSSKKLLVLTLGGVLVHRVYRRMRCSDYKADTYKGHRADLIVGNFLVFKRPYVEEFMKFCFERFEVGMWSSAMVHNTDDVLSMIMGGLKNKLLFVWDQKKCSNTHFKSLEKADKPIFVKELSKLWAGGQTLPRKPGKFSASNTLLIDDEPYKALRNPPNTAIFPHTYKVDNGSDDFLGPDGELKQFLDGLAEAEDVPSYVKDHPIGQPPITDSHPDWDFYSKIRGY
ncbi:Phosphoprotein phosphatase [Bertholletia excelsa]